MHPSRAVAARRAGAPESPDAPETASIQLCSDLSAAAVHALWRDDWPVILLGAAGLLAALWRGPRRAAGLIAATGVALGAVYLAKNDSSERYLTQLLRLLCVGAGLLLARLPNRLAGASGAFAVAALAGLRVGPPAVGRDPFPAVAARLRGLSAATVITAAPEAYGYLLPETRIEPMQPGARGAIVLDGAQRAYADGLSAAGPMLARVTACDGFRRPDGQLDYAATRIVRGVVVVRTG